MSHRIKIKDDIIKSLRPVLEQYEKQLLFAYLFGSTARGESGPSSDIDIAVYFTRGTPESYFEEKLSLHADLCRALKRSDVDVVILNNAVNIILLDEIVRTGLVLYDRDPGARTDFELKILHHALDFRSHRLAVMGV